MAVHIGNEIRRVMEERGQTVTGLSHEYGCSRVNMYKIFDRPSIDTLALQRLSLILRYDFFRCYSEEVERRIEK